MLTHRKKLTITLSAFALVLACLPYLLASQQRTPEKQQTPASSPAVSHDIESKLSRRADFIPRGKPALDQLVAIAQHYRIPMGIEWVKRSSSPERDTVLPARESGATVRELLEAIVFRLPGYEMTIQNGVVHVAQPRYASDARNFLNLLIEEFQVKNEHLIDAEYQLRLSIEMTLHPEEYEGGYIGGHGYDPDDVFAQKKFTFTGEDLTVREILDGLAKANGNALWIAQFDSDDFKTTDKSSTAKSARNGNQEGAKLKYQWKFVPLVEKPGNVPSRASLLSLDHPALAQTHDSLAAVEFNGRHSSS